jgi:hypothetical protein
MNTTLEARAEFRRTTEIHESTMPMKTTINTLLAIIAMSLTASAAPALLVETTISDHQANGGKEVLTVPSVTVESGKEVTIQAGQFEFGVTPTLLDDGNVDISTTIKADKPGVISMKGKLGNVAEIRIAQTTFTIKISLAK